MHSMHNRLVSHVSSVNIGDTLALSTGLHVSHEQSLPRFYGEICQGSIFHSSHVHRLLHSDARFVPGF